MQTLIHVPVVTVTGPLFDVTVITSDGGHHYYDRVIMLQDQYGRTNIHNEDGTIAATFSTTASFLVTATHEEGSVVCSSYELKRETPPASLKDLGLLPVPGNDESLG